MTKDKAKELLPIIEAFANGKVIEYLLNAKWSVATTPDWNPDLKYRIKPKPKLVPFTFEDNLLFRDRWVKVKGCMPMSKILSIDMRGVYFGMKNDVMKYDYCFKNFEFEDNSTFGKYVNE